MKWWRVVLVLTGCLGAGGIVLWLRVIDPAERHLEFCQVTYTELKTLSRKRPLNFTREQWHHIVAWTLNGHSNILTFKREIAQAERDRFVSELRRRLAGTRVDLATIDWIWDQFERLSPGSTYSARFRPTSPERLQQFQQEGFTWTGIEVD